MARRLRVQQQWRTGLATHQVQLAGYGVWGEQVPLSFLQTGFGIRGELDPEDPRPSSEAGLSLPGYLQTMHVYEFLTDRSLHLSYAFQTAPLIERQLGDVLIGPRLKLHQQYAVGTLENVERYQFFDFQTMEKGFWESGVELPQLVRIKNGSSFYNIGFGYFHRWGAYAFPRAADNGVWVMNLITSF
ncbi:hypothetical protein [Nitritalea halalkaliphila]|uniref:hypothetical protein n=1 Tax=Nitritalea halalkaliphila TaxID=590849 RepID=UPI0002E4DEBB|nr:hypothetical protein [Nitritalea halalkaliphila]